MPLVEISGEKRSVLATCPSYDELVSVVASFSQRSIPELSGEIDLSGI
ncbi:hypothetical protein ACGE24_05675 [Corynebacterium kroppenstedtii]